MAAHADFICEPCNAKGKMPDPVTLPVMAKKCPLCGKAKGLSRIWSGYTVGVVVKNGGEALPRMSHDEIKAVDSLTRPTLERHQQNRAPNDFRARAVPMGRLGEEMSGIAGRHVPVALPTREAASLAGAAFGRPNGLIPDQSVRPRTPREQTVVAGKWTPGANEMASAASAASA